MDRMAQTQTTIGKDVIESLTLGMYEDSQCIYREYIQNSDVMKKCLQMENLVVEMRQGCRKRLIRLKIMMFMW